MCINVKKIGNNFKAFIVNMYTFLVEKSIQKNNNIQTGFTLVRDEKLFKLKLGWNKAVNTEITIKLPWIKRSDVKITNKKIGPKITLLEMYFRVKNVSCSSSKKLLIPQKV